MRELKPRELNAAYNLCIARANASPVHTWVNFGCPSCRAAVVALVDEGVQPPAPPIIRAPAEDGHPDSVRLDWLSSDHNAKVYPSLGGHDLGWRVDHERGNGFSATSLRAAIDNAMAFDASRQGKETSDG